MSLFPAGTASTLRSAFTASLGHTYTRTPYRRGTADNWNQATRTPEMAVRSVACRYRAQDTLRLDVDGRVTISQPTLRVAHDDPLEVGDEVSAITDVAGTVLLAGPLVVDSIEAVAAEGSLLGRRAVLRKGTVAE